MISKREDGRGGDKTTVERIEALLIEKGWSASRLSQRAGLGKGAVNDILADPTRRPRDATLSKLARALGVDREYLSGESEVRRAGSRLLPGAGWTGAPADPLTAPILENLELGLGGEGRELRAYHLPPGAPGLGVPPDSTVLIAEGRAPQTGDLIVVQTEDGACIRYLAEPYLIGFDDEGRVRHWLRTESTTIVGKIVVIVRLP